jgi:hypothetical protein
VYSCLHDTCSFVHILRRTRPPKVFPAREIFLRFLAIPSAGALMRKPELGKALEAVPSLKFQGPLFQFSFLNREQKEHVGGLTIRIEFDPAKADVGYVVKAVAAVPGPERRKNQPAAILMVRTDSRAGLKDEQLESLWKQLSKVKGVDMEASRQLQHGSILGIVLDETGTARLQAIVAAVEATGAKVRDPRQLD